MPGEHRRDGDEQIRAAERAVAAARDITAPVTTGDHSPIDNRTIRLEPGSVLAGWQVEVAAPIRRIEAPRAAEFVGRKDALASLDRALAEDADQVVIPQVVHGMGGVGKSELVRHYAHDHQDRYPVAWWITADTTENLEQGFAALGAEIYPPIGLIGNVAEAAEWAVGWLRSHPAWLVVLDNVEEPAHVRPWLEHLSTGHVLITTRRDVYWPATRSLSLDVLAEGLAAELITRVSGYGEPHDGADVAAIASELGCLPLALEQAAAYVRESHISPGRYLERLRRHPARMYATSAEGGEAERTIARLWATHLDAIRERDKAGHLQAEHLLRTLACYAPDNIPRFLLGDGPDDLDLDDALRVLASYSMITRSGEDEQETVSMHRLFQSVVYNGLDYSDARSEAARAAALTWLSRALPDDPQFNVGGWPAWRELLPHIDAVALRYQDGNAPADLGRVLNHATIFVSVQGQYERAHDLASQELAIVEVALGPDHPEFAIALGNLAGSFSALGRPAEAVPLEQRSLAIVEAALGPDHPTVAIALGNLAGSFSALGRPAEAVPLQQRSLAIVEAALGPDHPQFAVTLGNLASSLRALGRPAEAVPLQQQMLAIVEAALGPDHPAVAIALGNLAGSFNNLGRHAEELPLKQRALAIVEAALGPDHPAVAIALGNLAGSFSALGRPAEAVPLEQRALAIVEAALGPDHPEFAMALGNLASSFRALGRHAEAVPLFKRALAIVEAALGPDHPTVVMVLGNLARSFSDLGRPAVAARLNQRALAIAEAARGPDQPQANTLRQNHLSTRNSPCECGSGKKYKRCHGRT